MFSRLIQRISRNFIRNYSKTLRFYKSQQQLCTCQIIAQLYEPLYYNVSRKYTERWLCTEQAAKDDQIMDQTTYEKVCSVTLDALNEYMEQLIENAEGLSDTDISYSDGVLTVKLGPQYGTYVINRQTPNRQIWLSSPCSGPKRYDFVASKMKEGEKGKWIYRHTGETLHQLLQAELQLIFKNLKLEFEDLPYGR